MFSKTKQPLFPKWPQRGAHRAGVHGLLFGYLRTEKPKDDIAYGNNFFVPKLRGIVQNVGESHHMPTGVAAVRERKFDSGGCDNVCSQGGCVNVDWARIILSFKSWRWSTMEHLSAMWHHI